MMALPAELIDRLAKVAGMLGSDHAGERAAAALQATRIIREAGWTWRDVIEAARRDTKRRSSSTGRPPGATRSTNASSALAVHGLGMQFLRSLAVRHRPPSPKQRAILDRLTTKATM